LSYNILVIDKLKKLNPEKNYITKTLLYTIGFFGSVHIISSTIQAIHRGDFTEINALKIDNLTAPISQLYDTPLFFLIGWTGFLIVFLVIRRWLRPKRR
jgi:hypothetical protein